jgi:16S rRNA (guanine527-N7)-methyltransferase
MDAARIAALLEPFLDRPLAPVQLGQISTYIDLLLRWNARINLTAIREPEGIVTRHFGESLFLARHVFPVSTLAGSGGAARVVDLGSGAGFPALPLKIWAPHVQLALIESNHRKAAFLRETARALTLTNIDVYPERAETLSARLAPAFPAADVVTFRAVEKFDRVLPLAASFLAPLGRLALLISAAQLPALKALPALSWRTTPVPGSKARVLSIGQ